MFKKLISKLKDRDPQDGRIILDSDAPISDGGVLIETFGIRSAWPKKRNIIKNRTIEAITSAKFEEKIRYRVV